MHFCSCLQFTIRFSQIMFGAYFSNFSKYALKKELNVNEEIYAIFPSKCTDCESLLAGNTNDLFWIF